MGLDDAQEETAGGVYLSFATPPKFQLTYCFEYHYINLTDLPSEIDKVWTITLSSISGERRFVMHCNEKEVFNLVLSETTCDDWRWDDIWTREVKKIEFLYHTDTASDFYRTGK